MASAFSCGTCRVKFSALDIMQAHYKCDWHRYNLKRKVADLPPISAEDFATIVRTYQKETLKDSAGNPLENETADKLYCDVCAKSFQSAGSLASHIESKKHLDRERGQSVSESSDGAPDSDEKAVTEQVPAKVSRVSSLGKNAGQVEGSKPEEDEGDWVDEGGSRC